MSAWGLLFELNQLFIAVCTVRIFKMKAGYFELLAGMAKGVPA